MARVGSFRSRVPDQHASIPVTTAAAGHEHVEAVQFDVDPPPDHVVRGPDELSYR